MFHTLAQGLIDTLYHSMRMLTFTGDREDLKKSHKGAATAWFLIALLVSTWVRIAISEAPLPAFSYEDAGIVSFTILAVVVAWCFFVGFLKDGVGVAACASLFLAFNFYSVILLALHYSDRHSFIVEDFAATRFILFSLILVFNVLALAYLFRTPKNIQSAG